jgi:hypothetical protein
MSPRTHPSIPTHTTACALALLTSLLTVAPAIALDEVGIFFDQTGSEFCLEAESFATVDAYMLLVEPSNDSGVYGFECSVEIENVTMLSVTFPAQAINVGDDDLDFKVGFANPVPHREAIELARLSLLISSSDPSRLFIHPTRNQPSIPDTPVYADGGDPNILIPMEPIDNFSEEGMVAGINLPQCVDEGVTWGQLKVKYE